MTRGASFTGRPETDVRQLRGNQIGFADITTPNPAGSLTQIEHGLGRVPKGYSIVKGPFLTFQYGWNEGDTEWTTTHIYLRFSIADANLTLAFF